MSVISDMTDNQTDHESDAFSSKHAYAGQSRGGPHGLGWIFHHDKLSIYFS